MFSFHLFPCDASTLECVVVDIGQQPQGAVLLVAGNFDVDMESPYRHKRNEAIASAMEKEGLEDMINHFLP